MQLKFKFLPKVLYTFREGCVDRNCRMCLFWSIRSTHLHRGLIIHPGRTRRRYFVSRFYAVIQLGNCAVFFVTAYNVPGQCTVAPDEIWVDIWDICFENEGNTSFVYTTCASAAILINDGAKTLTRNVQSNEKINNISVYVTVYASVASKTRILKTATHRHAVSDADVFFLLDTEKKAYAQTFWYMRRGLRI